MFGIKIIFNSEERELQIGNVVGEVFSRTKYHTKSRRQTDPNGGGDELDRIC